MRASEESREGARSHVSKRGVARASEESREEKETELSSFLACVRLHTRALQLACSIPLARLSAAHDRK